MRQRVASPPDRPLLIFDGDCGFCRTWIGRWRDLTGERIGYVPFQASEISSLFPELSRDELKTAVHLIETNGIVYRAAEAVFRSLAAVPQKRWLLTAYESIPGFALVSEAVYGVIARHRPAAAVVQQIAWGREISPTYQWGAWLFLRSLGLIFLVAFLSFWTQASGLIGSRGIVPVGDSIEAFQTWMSQAGIGIDRYRWFPTLFWLNSSDTFLHTVCGAGVFLSVLLLLGVATPLSLLLLWIGYLSLQVVAGEFLAYQWDVLLLEMALLGILLTPPQWVSRRVALTPGGLWLLRFLLFRLLFSSGVVKLASGDQTWRDLTALQFHYETQPLPTWIGWYAHQLPAWFQTVSAVLLFTIELVVSFMIFAPRRLRLTAGMIFIAFEGLIWITGNYGFFGWQVLALCFLLIDDTAFNRVVPNRIRAWAARPARRPGPSRLLVRRGWPRWLLVPAVIILSISATGALAVTLRTPIDAIPPIGMLRAFIAPLRSVNTYGLFAIMTTTRPEILMEGSRDGKTWAAYDFKYKPDDPRARPSFVAPHQPRLDWQLWFAALGRCAENQWFVNFTVRLLEGSPDVLALLAHNPFPDAPPRFVRSVIYMYRFTDREVKATTGAWWARVEKGPYCPVLPQR